MARIPSSQSTTPMTSQEVSVEAKLADFIGLTTIPKPWFDFDSHAWWYNMKDRFPRIFRVKMRLDCVSATSLDPERAFSIANYTLTKYSNQMSQEKLELRIKVKANIAPRLKIEIKHNKEKIFKGQE